jgi:hypothetical protein
MRQVTKVKHPKGFGTDKEHHKKPVWYEVRCDMHGTGDRKTFRVTAPKSRFERNVRGCPVCYKGAAA